MRPGEVFGLLGPNGAGKSTTIACISGLREPTAGSIRVLGHDVHTEGVASRRELGVVPQELALYEDLSAYENLLYWASLFGLRGADLKKRIDETLERIGLRDRAREPVSRYSGGMKRRLNFGCGIVHKPKVLLLDEPTVGVDPQSRERLIEVIREQTSDGTCVLYTTHYMEEAEELCDRLAIVDHGKSIAEGTLEELRGILGEKDVLRLSGTFPVEDVRRQLTEMLGVEIVQADHALLRLALADASQRLPELFSVLSGVGAKVSETTMSRPSLQSLFIKLTGKELRE